MDLVDVLIALVAGLVIFRLGLWAVRALASPVPGPDPEDVVEVEVDYRCSVCGTRVTMTHAATSELKPPRHCREEMDPVP